MSEVTEKHCKVRKVAIQPPFTHLSIPRVRDAVSELAEDYDRNCCPFLARQNLADRGGTVNEGAARWCRASQPVFWLDDIELLIDRLLDSLSFLA